MLLLATNNKWFQCSCPRVDPETCEVFLISAFWMLELVSGSPACFCRELSVNYFHKNCKSECKISHSEPRCFSAIINSVSRNKVNELFSALVRTLSAGQCVYVWESRFVCDLLDPDGKLHVPHSYPLFPWLLIHGLPSSQRPQKCKAQTKPAAGSQGRLKESNTSHIEWFSLSAWWQHFGNPRMGNQAAIHPRGLVMICY